MNHTPTLAALATVNTPATLTIRKINDYQELLADLGRRSIGYAGETLFGTAFMQGGRLQFTSAVPIQKLLDISKADLAKKQDGVEAVSEKSNRPTEPAHARELRYYLLTTACVGEKFILPAFTLNYGVDRDAENSPEVVLLLYVTSDAVNVWPGILMIPYGEKLEVTDGGHRRGQMQSLLEDPKVGDDKKHELRKNSVDVKIVFEPDRTSSHQDFADCGKAKPIAKSLQAVYDVRDKRNERTTLFIKRTPFVNAYVDATAANVNLSVKSKKAWSTSAVRLFMGHIIDNHPERPKDASILDPRVVETETKYADGVEAFFAELIGALPQFQAMSATLLQVPPKVIAGDLRDINGGDVALRAVGMALFARAFLFCAAEGVAPAVMAQRLSTLDWHLLDCPRPNKDNAEGMGAVAYRAFIAEHANPLWAGLLVVGDDRYRVSTRSVDVDDAWERVVAKLFPASEIAPPLPLMATAG